MKRIFTGLMLLMSIAGTAQETSLWVLLQKSQENYPLAANGALIDSITRLKEQNNQIMWYPQVNLVGQSTYQSAVTKLTMPAQFQSIEPNISKDQHKIYLDISQMLYDGGAVSSQRMLAEANGASQQAQQKLNMHDLKSQITSAYFAVLLANASLQQQESLADVLQKRLGDVNAGIVSGTVMKSSQSIIKVQLIQVKQQIDEINSAKSYAMQVLSLLSGVVISDSAEFSIPDTIPAYNGSMPELNVIDAQINQQNAVAELTKVNRRPQLAAFGQAGYGKPGLNMLGTSWDTYYLVGAKLSWNIWDWNKTKHDRQVIRLTQSQLQDQKSAVTTNMTLKIDQQNLNIQKLSNQLESDQQIVNLRSQISGETLAALKTGTARESDYVSDLNNEFQARLEMEKHRLQLQQAKVLKVIISGF
ncbi:MAG TPA: TolC family protein [Williamwhitmania sp.]|nr:TolC family protein [Williamwhitmania sp.]